MWVDGGGGVRPHACKRPPLPARLPPPPFTSTTPTPHTPHTTLAQATSWKPSWTPTQRTPAQQRDMSRCPASPPTPPASGWAQTFAAGLRGGSSSSSRRRRRAAERRRPRGTAGGRGRSSGRAGRGRRGRSSSSRSSGWRAEASAQRPGAGRGMGGWVSWRGRGGAMPHETHCLVGWVGRRSRSDPSPLLFPPPPGARV